MLENTKDCLVGGTTCPSAAMAALPPSQQMRGCASFSATVAHSPAY